MKDSVEKSRGGRTKPYDLPLVLGEHIVGIIWKLKDDAHRNEYRTAVRICNSSAGMDLRRRKL